MTCCKSCKLPFSKVGRFDETDYCFACWIVVSGTPITDLVPKAGA